MFDTAKASYAAAKQGAMNSLGLSKGQVVGEVIGSLIGLIILVYMLPEAYTQVQNANLTNVPGGDFLATGVVAIIAVVAGGALIMNIVNKTGLTDSL